MSNEKKTQVINYITEIKNNAKRNNFLFQRRRISCDNSSKKTLGWIMTPENSETKYENTDINVLNSIKNNLEGK